MKGGNYMFPEIEPLCNSMSPGTDMIHVIVGILIRVLNCHTEFSFYLSKISVIKT